MHRLIEPFRDLISIFCVPRSGLATLTIVTIRVLKFANRARSAAVYIPPSLFQWAIFMFALSRLKWFGIKDYRNALWLGFVYCLGAVVAAKLEGVFVCKVPELLAGVFVATAGSIGLTYFERFKSNSPIHIFIGLAFGVLFIELQTTHSISTLSLSRLFLDYCRGE